MTHGEAISQPLGPAQHLQMSRVCVCWGRPLNDWMFKPRGVTDVWQVDINFRILERSLYLNQHCKTFRWIKASGIFFFPLNLRVHSAAMLFKPWWEWEGAAKERAGCEERDVGILRRRNFSVCWSSARKIYPLEKPNASKQSRAEWRRGRWGCNGRVEGKFAKWKQVRNAL